MKKKIDAIKLGALLFLCYLEYTFIRGSVYVNLLDKPTITIVSAIIMPTLILIILLGYLFKKV